MSYGVGAESAGDGKDTLDVAIIEQQTEILGNVLALAAETHGLEMQVLDDAASYFEVYGSSSAPDLLLVGLDANPSTALSAAKRIAALAPTCGIIVYGSSATMDLLSQAMAAGARRYLAYPFDSPTLLKAAHDVSEEMKPLIANARLALPAHDLVSAERVQRGASDPKVITVFSPKGGVGTSTLAVNLACALNRMQRRVVVLDGNIRFGNIGVFLNLSPLKSMLQVVGDPAGVQEATIEDVLLLHPSGIQVMLSPLKPEEADSIQTEHLRQIITILKSRFDYVVVDTWPSYDERVLVMLEMADRVLVPTGPELPSVKNLASFLRVARLLDYPDDKIIPVLMRANTVSPGHLRDIESFLKQPLVWRIVSDGRRVTDSVNSGEPFVLTEPNALVSQNVFALARMLDGQKDVHEEASDKVKQMPFWKRPRFGLGKKAS